MEAVLIVRILVVSQYFWPENFRINDLCAELARRGHKVTVLTGLPNYPSGQLFAAFQDSPESYNVYQGVSIVRVPIILRGRSKFSLALNYLSYPLIASTIGLFKLRKMSFDIVFICQLSPVFLSLPGIVYNFISNTPIIMWIVDLWPESLAGVNVKNKAVLKFTEYYVSFLYKRCSLLLGQSKAFSQNVKKYQGGLEKFRYFPSWAEHLFLNKGVSEGIVEFDEFNGFKILFAGNIGEAQDFPSIIKAAERLAHKRINAKFFILGSGSAFERSQFEVHSRGLTDHIEFLGRYPLERMPDFYDRADALLVTLKKSAAFDKTIPAKVQGYMTASKPILTMLTGEGSRIVSEANCGLTAESGDFERLVENISALIGSSRREKSALAANGRRYAEAEFNRDKLISKLENWFCEVLTNRKLIQMAKK